MTIANYFILIAFFARISVPLLRSGSSYKHVTFVIDDSRVIITTNVPNMCTM